MSTVTTLRHTADRATERGDGKAALAAYLELERLEPHDPNWAKRAAEAARKLGDVYTAASSFRRAALGFAKLGKTPQAAAMQRISEQLLSA